MAKEDNADLLVFLRPFSPKIQDLALWLRDFVWDRYPQSNELIYDNYNALAFGWSPSDKMGDIFCSVAVYNDKAVHLGFYWGSKIDDPENRLLGNGKQYRYRVLKEKEDLPVEYALILIANAYTYSLNKVKDIAKAPQGTTTTKAVVAVKKRPGVLLPKTKKK